MNIDLTKVLGSIVLIGGAIASAVYDAFPVEVNLSLVSAGMALWIVPPVWKETKEVLRSVFQNMK
jgi:hypothetical protein